MQGGGGHQWGDHFCTALDGSAPFHQLLRDLEAAGSSYICLHPITSNLQQLNIDPSTSHPYTSSHLGPEQSNLIWWIKIIHVLFFKGVWGWFLVLDLFINSKVRIRKKIVLCAGRGDIHYYLAVQCSLYQRWTDCKEAGSRNESTDDTAPVRCFEPAALLKSCE